MRLLGLAVLLLRLPRAPGYCLPTSSCWPSSAQWDALGASLSAGTSALAPLSAALYDEECYEHGSDAIGLRNAFGSPSTHGICMQDHHCKFEACTEDKELNLPAYSAAVATVEDVQKVLGFANIHNISVSIKTSGHSYAGSSTMKGSLLIWMARFERSGTVDSHVDSCGTSTDHVLKIGGGQVWGEAYQAADEMGREVVGGGGLTVSAAGGWLMGGGLSALSRTHGYGIDNVLAFEVVTADGIFRTVDACSESELFWALRGGGGGSFGVVTAAYYRTYLPSAVTAVTMNIAVTEANWWTAVPALESWIDFWVDTSPSLGTDWSGGYWSLSSIIVLYFRGTRAEAESSFIDALQAWRSELSRAQQVRTTVLSPLHCRHLRSNFVP